MILPDKRINAICQLGNKINSLLECYHLESSTEFKDIIIKARIENPWFTEESILTALHNWAAVLNYENVHIWAKNYSEALGNQTKDLKIGVVNAGNIPFVGLHDLLSVLLCGFNYIGKNATGDSLLLPFLTSLLVEIEPLLKGRILFASRLQGMDAVIATGNNNSSRYFEYYFGKYPHIIRKNRNGVGVLTGDETKTQLAEFGKDIFTYFGLGCRNISKVFVPKNYSFNNFFESILSFHPLLLHSKYMNNFDYNNSVFLLKRISFLQNGFLIIRKENQISSPVSVLHYEEYGNIEELEFKLMENKAQLQCIVTSGKMFISNKNLEEIRVDFGKSQSPFLLDYADGIDTIKFLTSL